MATPQPDACPADARQLDLDPVAVPAEQRRRPDLGQRHAEPAGSSADDREGIARCAGHGQVAALDDGGLLPGNGRDRRTEAIHVVESHVRDDRHPAIPGVRRVEAAAEAHFDDRDVEIQLGEPSEDRGGQELELGRWSEPGRQPFGDAESLEDEPRERDRIDRPAVDLEPFAVRHEVGLRRLADPEPRGAECARDQRQHAALAVRARDEGPTELSLRVPQGRQERPRPPEPEVDPEAAPLAERSNRRLVVAPEVAPRHSRPVLASQRCDRSSS